MKTALALFSFLFVFSAYAGEAVSRHFVAAQAPRAPAQSEKVQVYKVIDDPSNIADTLRVLLKEERYKRARFQFTGDNSNGADTLASFNLIGYQVTKIQITYSRIAGCQAELYLNKKGAPQKWLTFGDNPFPDAVAAPAGEVSPFAACKR